MLAQILLYTALSGVLSMIGGVFLLGRVDLLKKYAHYFIAFAAGALLSIAFTDLMPEALEFADGDPAKIFSWVLGGFLVFFLIERVIIRLHAHHFGDSPEHEHPTPILMMAGDALHNFIDGVAITATFLADPTLGVVTALGIAAHELPQEIGDFSVLILHNWKRKTVLWVNFLISLTAVVGSLLAYLAKDTIISNLPQLLSLTAGIFIYIAASDLIPEATKKYKRFSVAFYLLLGIILVSYLGHLFE